MDNSYNISEIFYSIQGEGVKTLTPTVFVRFYGCNLNCSFCDEPLHKIVKKAYTKEELLEKVIQLTPICKSITITGGEPSIYNLNPLIRFLQKNGYIVNIESNGFNIDNIKEANYITVSPKDSTFNDDLRINEYKILIGGKGDIAFAKYCLLHKAPTQKVFIQPINNKDTICENNLRLCIEEVKKDNRLNLSIQLHKLLGVE